jgi:ribonuclease Z
VAAAGSPRPGLGRGGIGCGRISIPASSTAASAIPACSSRCSTAAAPSCSISADLTPLGARDLLRVSHVFVTHTHIDHFIGFDALLRVSVGREKRIAMVGPEGFADRVHHKLLAYDWDLVDRYESDLVFDVTELAEGGRTRAARFRFKRAFAREELDEGVAEDGLVATGEGFEVRAAVLRHHGPSIGFAVAEPAHFNVWKNRLASAACRRGRGSRR